MIRKIQIFSSLIVISFLISTSFSQNTNIFINPKSNILNYPNNSAHVTPYNGNQNSKREMYNSDLIKRNKKLHKSISSCKILSITGSTIHFTGSVLTMISLFVDDPVMLTSGFALEALGPIPSCIGATIIEKKVGAHFVNLPKHNYWGNYGSSWAFSGLFITAATVEFIVNKKSDFISPVIPIFLFAVKLGVLIGAKTYSAKASLGPILYAKKAEKIIPKKVLSINIVPQINYKGDIGLSLLMTH